MKGIYYLLFFGFVFLNCAKTNYYLKDLNKNIRMSGYSEKEGYKAKRKFEINSTRINLVWGLVNYQDRDLDSLVATEWSNPEKEAIGNLTIIESYSFLDSLIDWLVVGLIRPYSVVLKGTMFEKVNTATETNESKEKKK